jgi:hypothetical protein
MAKQHENLIPGVTKCNRPKISSHGGRTWDSCDITLKDGTQIKGFLDTTWGDYVYFEYDGAWRKFSLVHADTHFVDLHDPLRNVFDFREFKLPVPKVS